LLSPYRPPTSYPVTLTDDEAAAWLNGYAAVWHPAAVRGAAAPPAAASAYDHDQPAAGAVYVVPGGPHVYQPDDWTQRVSAAGAVAAAANADRAETIGNLVAALREAGETVPDLPDETIHQFAGIGLGYLVVETLFDAMEHEHLLDASGFWADLQTAAEAAFNGQPVREPLKAAAEKLQTARETLYSSSIHLLELILLDSANPGGPWPRSLVAGVPVSLVATADALDRLAAEHLTRFAELKARCPVGLPGSVDFCIGAARDRADALLPAESQFWSLREARAAVKRLVDVEPTIYARPTPALHPHLPSWLRHAGFTHAVVSSFDPTVPSPFRAAVVNWPAPDGKAVDAFAKAPLPAGEWQTWFNLAYHLHQAVTNDAAPTLAFWHKGGAAPPPHADLLALADLSPVLGSYAGLTQYFNDVLTGEYVGPSTADDFAGDPLDDRVTHRHRPDPVSGFARHQRLRRRLDAAVTYAALLRTLSPESPGEAEALAALDRIESAVEARGEDVGPADTTDTLSPELESLEAATARRLTDRILARSEPGRPGFLVLNPCGFTRRVALELDAAGAIPVEGPVKAAEVDGDVCRVVVEVPGCGFAWIPNGGGIPSAKPRIKTAEGHTVRNEFVEADIDSQTGGLRSIRDTRTRTTRLGQLLVYNPGSTMKARSVAVTKAGTALGEAVSEGDLVDDHGEVLATFRQRVRAWVGRPVLELAIDIDPKRPPQHYPWHSYFAARFAWRDDRAAVYRGINGAAMPSTANRPGSPEFVEVRFGATRTTLFTGGLPFAQKSGGRMLDVVLLPEGETARSFEVLIAFDRDHPAQTAAGWVAPAAVVPTDKGPPPVGPTGWLAHVDLPSLLMTSLKPVAPTADGMTRAVAARFVETAGFGGTADLLFARTPGKAYLVDDAGAMQSEIALTGDPVGLEFSANELFRVRAEWA
jgi:hypothetical protein